MKRFAVLALMFAVPSGTALAQDSDPANETVHVVKPGETLGGVAQRAGELLGVGPVTSSALAAAVPDAKVFQSGRQFGAWLGLAPRLRRVA